MHFEILVEDRSGKEALDIFIPKILGDAHTYIVHAYKGIGRVPRNMKDPENASKRILLQNLPKILKGYGKAFAGYGDEYQAVVIMVCDLDEKCFKTFRENLIGILKACNPKPETRFCIAIEEGEAWFLGDVTAIKAAYPNAKVNILESYVNDSICGTWEKLADAIFPGGSSRLIGLGRQTIGKAKNEWAIKIAPHMNPEKNNSPSFCYFRDKLYDLVMA